MSRPLARSALILLVVLASGLCLGAKDLEKPSWEKVKAFFKGEKPIPPEEELFREGEDYFYGHVTWWGRTVAKTQGEDSKAYKEWWGIKRKNYSRAKEAYQKLADNYRYSKHAPIAELRIADCSYHLEEFEQAAFGYKQFRVAHPRHPEVPYALYQEALSHQELMLKAGRDQKEAKEASVLYDLFVHLYPDSEYFPQAKQGLDEVNTRLAEHELLVAEFYFKKKNYWAAAARYRTVWNKYPGLGFDDQAMYQEGLCYESLGKNDLAVIIYDRAVEQFPDTEFGQKALEKRDQLNQPEAAPEP